MENSVILRLVGIALILLGGTSGVALFLRAVVGKDNISEGPGMGTLWGLYIFGMATGMIIIAFTL